MNAALVPIKHLTAGKSRLAGALDRAGLERLCLAMMEDVVAALIAADGFDRVVVATPDETAAKAAERLGADAFLGPDPGLNPAIEAGCARLEVEGAASVTTVLGDVAAADPAELARLLEATRALAARRGGAAVGLAPAADGGTAALVRMPPDAIASRFGRDSAAQHRGACQRAGVALVELELASLRLDLDRVEDVETFLALDEGGPRTRAALDELGWRRDARAEEPT